MRHLCHFRDLFVLAFAIVSDVFDVRRTLDRRWSSLPERNGVALSIRVSCFVVEDALTVFSTFPVDHDGGRVKIAVTRFQ